jgi:hypothetical protein
MYFEINKKSKLEPVLILGDERNKYSDHDPNRFYK